MYHLPTSHTKRHHSPLTCGGARVPLVDDDVERVLFGLVFSRLYADGEGFGAGFRQYRR